MKKILTVLSLVLISSTVYSKQIDESGLSKEQLVALSIASKFKCTFTDKALKMSSIDLAKLPDGKVASWVEDSSDKPGQIVVTNVYESSQGDIKISMEQLAIFENNKLVYQKNNLMVNKKNESGISARFVGPKVSFSLSQNAAELAADNKGNGTPYITASIDCSY